MLYFEIYCTMLNVLVLGPGVIVPRQFVMCFYYVLCLEYIFCFNFHMFNILILGLRVIDTRQFVLCLHQLKIS